MITKSECEIIAARYKKLIENKGECVAHFKGKWYTVLDIANHTETGEAMVIYKANYGTEEVYVRPVAMFLSEVDRYKYPDAKQKYRFMFMEELE